MLDDETINEEEPLTIFDPVDTWKRMTLTNYRVRELLVPIFRKGRRVYDSPPLLEIQKYAKRELDTLWDEYKRIKKPHIYKVDFSERLYNLKNKLLREYSFKHK